VELSNYLFFTSACEPALAFYERCGLGRVVELHRNARGLVQHARFEGPGVRFFASDNDDAEPMRGSAHFLVLGDRAETERLFGRLAEHGRITTPLAVQPWGDYYGKLTDRFGVQWMLDCPPPEPCA
jgi:PhnB protein